MSTGAPAAAGDLAFKITKLVEEKGWNQEDFARISNLNRHTVRQILLGGPQRRLRNATVSQCAEALGLTVNELRTLPVEKLLSRMHGKTGDEESLKLLETQSTLPELMSWVERNRERATELRPDEVAELLDMQNPGGPLERLGVEYCVDLIERRRVLLAQVRGLTGTEFFECLERIVGLMAEKVARANRGRG